MKVLMTTDTIGGVWTFTKELATELLHDGCEIALVSFGRAPSASQRQWCENLREEAGAFFRYEFSDVPLEWMDDNASAFTAGSEILLRIAEQFAPHLLLSSQFCFGALSVNVPKIIVAHSDVLSWAEACRTSPLAPSSWLDHYSSIVARGLERATAVVAPTGCMLAALAKNFCLPPGTFIIPNGRTFEPSISERRLQAITAGRLWDEAKNLRILNSVSAPMPILIAGEAGHGLASQSTSIQGATFVGPQTEHDLLSLFSESSIYICTSVYEPFGLAPLEAALCGCAVLANDIPSLREVWSGAALYFSSAASLSVTLARLHNDPALLRSMQQRSFERASTFTARRMADAYLELLTRVRSNEGSVAHAA